MKLFKLAIVLLFSNMNGAFSNDDFIDKDFHVEVHNTGPKLKERYYPYSDYNETCLKKPELEKLPKNFCTMPSLYFTNLSVGIVFNHSGPDADIANFPPAIHKLVIPEDHGASSFLNILTKPDIVSKMSIVIYADCYIGNSNPGKAKWCSIQRPVYAQSVPVNEAELVATTLQININEFNCGQDFKPSWTADFFDN